jgi:hypothetical protein
MSKYVVLEKYQYLHLSLGRQPSWRKRSQPDWSLYNW